MTRLELIADLKTFKLNGYEVTVKLNAKNDELMAEWNRLVDLHYMAQHIAETQPMVEAYHRTPCVPAWVREEDTVTQQQHKEETTMTTQCNHSNDSAIKVSARLAARTYVYSLHAIKTHDYARDYAIFNLVAMTCYLWGQDARAMYEAFFQDNHKEIVDAITTTLQVCNTVIGWGKGARVQYNEYLPVAKWLYHNLVWVPMSLNIGNDPYEGRYI